MDLLILEHWFYNSCCTSASFSLSALHRVVDVSAISAVASVRLAATRRVTREVRSQHRELRLFSEGKGEGGKKRKVIWSWFAAAKCAESMDYASPERWPVRYVRSMRLESSRRHASYPFRIFCPFFSPLSFFFQRKRENIFFYSLWYPLNGRW